MRIVIIICFALWSCKAVAQETDTAKSGLHNIFQFAINAVTRGHSDSVAILNTRSETPFLAYKGKIIRHIIIKEYGFEQVFTDTTKKIQYFGTKLLNNLHRQTRDWVIRDNLFIKENTPLDIYKTADNERHLRSLEFIQDARILVNHVLGKPDSVDVIVVTKDLFSITGELNDATTTLFKAKAGDANAFGIGQKIQLTALLEKGRSPSAGYEFLYSKSNIAGSFINASADYTMINSDLTDGTPDEHAWYLKLDRPLVSLYSYFAGAFTIGNNQSYNDYHRPDSTFYQYNYNTFDMWVGYNLGVKKFLRNPSIRDRKFVSLRYFQNRFSQTPFQLGNQFNYRFNDKEALLAQFTFFKQNFYKTNYIFGFGNTEDVPYGYNVSLTAGVFKQLYLKRPYMGIDANKYVATAKKDFIQYFLRAGTFLHDGQWQDASILIGTGIFSHLFLYNHIKIRQYVNFSYTRQFNRIGLDPLGINNPFGLRNFGSDSVLGYQRISMHSETSFFLQYKLFGFKFAPFAFGDGSLLTPEKGSFYQSGLYYGIGGGVRTRNENLVFGTIELRFIYFPRHVIGNNTFGIAINSDIRFRSNSNYVKAPDLIQLNTDPTNSVF